MKKMFFRKSLLVLVTFLLLIIPFVTVCLADDDEEDDYSFGIELEYLYGYDYCWINTDSYVELTDVNVTVKIGNSTYTKKVGDWEGDDEDYISVPVDKHYKIGTKIFVTLTAKDEDGSAVNVTKTGKVKKPETSVMFWLITSSDRKVKVQVKDPATADRIKVKIGSKTYTKKIPRGHTKKKNYTVKIGASQPGVKMTVWVENKYKQKVTKKVSDVVYSSRTLRMGLTKDQARLILGWRYPDEKYVYSYVEQWCYDMNGDGYHDSYLYFTNGRVSSWSYKKK